MRGRCPECGKFFKTDAYGSFARDCCEKCYLKYVADEPKPTVRPVKDTRGLSLGDIIAASLIVVLASSVIALGLYILVKGN
jgi:hypothetical protein